jgi:SAM-dependent methyltransferase
VRSPSDLNREVLWDGSEGVPLAHHSVYRKVDRFLLTHAPGRILEVGCGSGRFLAHLRERGWSVQGVELQPQEADFVLQHDLTQPLPYGQEFDVVLAVEVVEHLVDTAGFLLSCQRVLKPGGQLILSTPNLLFLASRIAMLFGHRPYFAYADYHVRMFVWDDLREKLKAHFVIQRLMGSHILLGSRAGVLYPLFAWLADRFPTLAAHFIVVARTSQDSSP